MSALSQLATRATEVASTLDSILREMEYLCEGRKERRETLVDVRLARERAATIANIMRPLADD